MMHWTVEPKYIDAAEAKLGAAFPKSYRRHIVAANGGSLSLLDDVWRVLPIWGTSTTKRASRTSNDVVRETLRLRQLHWFPAAGVAIALSNTDAIVLIAAEGRIEDRCFVWYFDGDGLDTIADSCDSLFAKRGDGQWFLFPRLFVREGVRN